MVDPRYRCLIPLTHFANPDGDKGAKTRSWFSLTDAPLTAWAGFTEGDWWVQDASAAAPARLLGIEPGQTALDLCAAPGGKTLQLAAAGAKTTAVDKSAPRLKRLSANLERTRLSAEVVTADAANWPDKRRFDAVLLDAPCSATGTFRRHPDVLDRLVLVSAAMKQDGFYPEVVAAFRQLEANAATLGPGVKASPLGQTYPDVDWTNLFRKVGDLTKRPFDWSAEVARLRARTLLVYADADAIRPEHAVEFWKALGGGQRDAGIDGSLRPANQLAIVPGATHYTIPVDPMLPEIVGRFLGTALKAAN